jgi:hypothetical protein
MQYLLVSMVLTADATLYRHSEEKQNADMQEVWGEWVNGGYKKEISIKKNNPCQKSRGYFCVIFSSVPIQATESK